MTVMTHPEFQDLVNRVQRTTERVQSAGLRLATTVRQVTHPFGVSLGGPGLEMLLDGVLGDMDEVVSWAIARDEDASEASAPRVHVPPRDDDEEAF